MMSDLISRHALCEYALNQKDKSVTPNDIMRFPSAQPKPHWIPCSERLPEAEVLCCDIRGEMIIGYPYQDNESETGYSAVFDDVYMIDCIAWMPLPKAYKEGK